MREREFESGSLLSHYSTRRCVGDCHFEERRASGLKAGAMEVTKGRGGGQGYTMEGWEKTAGTRPPTPANAQ